MRLLQWWIKPGDVIYELLLSYNISYYLPSDWIRPYNFCNCSGNGQKCSLCFHDHLPIPLNHSKLVPFMNFLNFDLYHPRFLSLPLCDCFCDHHAQIDCQLVMSWRWRILGSTSNQSKYKQKTIRARLRWNLWDHRGAITRADRANKELMKKLELTCGSWVQTPISLRRSMHYLLERDRKLSLELIYLVRP